MVQGVTDTFSQLSGQRHETCVGLFKYDYTGCPRSDDGQTVSVHISRDNPLKFGFPRSQKLYTIKFTEFSKGQNQF